MAGLCEGRVAIVTGAGRGIGREHALMLASEGASVVVNDLGGDSAGVGSDLTPAQEVVDEIVASGGNAVVNGADVTNFEQARAMVDQAVQEFGRLDILINNAGILRDRMIFSMDEAEWDSVVAVHLKGHFCPSRHAAAHWRERSKAGDVVDARIINTASPSGLYGNVGQANYGAAKAGIAALTMVSALELGRYGVTVNCLAPTAMTRLVAPLMGGEENIPEATKEALAPRWIAAVATWLASPDAAEVTGRVFDVRGDTVAVAEGWHRGPDGTNPGTPAGVGEVLAKLVADARPNADLDGRDDPERYRGGLTFTYDRRIDPTERPSRFVPARIPENEELRLESLRLCNVLDTGAEDAFDDLTLLVSMVCDVPMALVSLVDESRQWFKSHRGLEASETPRDQAFCAHAILQPDDLLVVPDALEDDRFGENPLVVGPPHIRFYAGCPIVTDDGAALGTVCVLDTRPRELDEDQRTALRLVAGQAQALLESRRDQITSDESAASMAAEVEGLRARMQERTEFLARAEHALKTPISVIAGWVRVMRTMSDGGPGDRNAAGLAALHRAIDSLTSGVTDLLEAARVEVLESTLDIEELDVAAIAEAVVSDLAVTAPQCQLTARSPGGAVRGRADEAALRLVLSHLIENAVKYSPEGGAVSVTVERDGSEVSVSVVDAGMGFPPDLDVFVPFQRAAAAKAATPGSGIGLHLVRTLVETMKGSVSASNNESQGSTFRFSIPAA